MDTRDQTLTKLTRLHDKSHPTHHRPASLRWNYSCTAVSIMKLVMEDGWWWRREDESPSPEPRTDSRSALPRGFRAWQWLRIVKRDDFFSLVFLLESSYIELELESGGLQGAHEVGARPGGAPPTLVRRVWAPWSSSLARIFYYLF